MNTTKRTGPGTHYSQRRSYNPEGPMNERLAIYDILATPLSATNAAMERPRRDSRGESVSVAGILLQEYIKAMSLGESCYRDAQDSSREARCWDHHSSRRAAHLRSATISQKLAAGHYARARALRTAIKAVSAMENR